MLVERYPNLGGVCLNVGCIPSKALLHAAAVIDEAAHASTFGIDFGKPKITLDTLREYKQNVVNKLTAGLAVMAKQRKVRTVTGIAHFVSPNTLDITAADGSTQRLHFQQCIIATGSHPVKLPNFLGTTRASWTPLTHWNWPKCQKLLVVGGGIIGLEMATVYNALGSHVTIVEFMDQIIPGTDKDLVKPLADRMKKQGIEIHLNTKASHVKADKKASPSHSKHPPKAHNPH